jgi:hypothetical protein
MSLNRLKVIQNTSHYWKKPPFLFKCFKKASHHCKKAPIPLKMFLKSLAIFKKP